MNQSEATRTAINVIFLICFYLNPVGNGNDDISSEAHFENSKTSTGSYLGLQAVIFLTNIWILSRDPVPLKLHEDPKTCTWRSGSAENAWAQLWIIFSTLSCTACKKIVLKKSWVRPTSLITFPSTINLNCGSETCWWERASMLPNLPCHQIL